MAMSLLLKSLRRRDLPCLTLAAHRYLTTSAQKSRPFGCNIIGIDLGTTYSRVAVLGEKNAEVIKNCEGSRATPSVVAIEHDNEILVGTLAKCKAVTNPSNTFFGIKRLIGRRFDDPQTQKMMELVPYKISKASHPNCNDIVLDRDGGFPNSPRLILAYILKEMKEAAESYLGRRVHGAIITVPAYFNDAQRRAAEMTGGLLGELDFVRIIDEPTAAALAYDYGINNKEGLIAVFDLGGATFDVSILKISNGVFELKATNGDTWLGGEDFDDVVVEYLVSEFKRSEGIDINLKEDRLALHKLREAAEEAKIQLSSKSETQINLPFMAADKAMNITLTRSKFESLVNHLIEKIIKPCESCLRDAGISSTEQLDEVLLVGGMTRVPKVQEVVSEIFGSKISKGSAINPEETLALGAVKEQFFLNINPLSLGIECWGGIFTSIIDRNTILPTKRSQVFYYPEIGNHVRVFQGERKMATDNKLLAEFELVDVLPAPVVFKSSVEVTFDIDANGVLTVSAKCTAACDGGKEIQIAIPSSSRELSEDVIEKMVTEGELHVEKDIEMRDLVEARKVAETKLYKEEAAFSRYRDKVPPETAREIETLLDDLRNVIGKDNSDEIGEKSSDVSTAITDFKFKFCKEELAETLVKEIVKFKKDVEAYISSEEKIFINRYRDYVPAEDAKRMENYLAELRKALGNGNCSEYLEKYWDARHAFGPFKRQFFEKVRKYWIDSRYEDIPC